jgi:hypothetical protein
LRTQRFWAHFGSADGFRQLGLGLTSGIKNSDIDIAGLNFLAETLYNQLNILIFGFPELVDFFHLVRIVQQLHFPLMKYIFISVSGHGRLVFDCLRFNFGGNL